MRFGESLHRLLDKLPGHLHENYYSVWDSRAWLLAAQSLLNEILSGCELSVSIRPSVREGAASLGRVVDQATAESLWNVYKQRKPTDGSYSSFVFIFHFHDLRRSRATLPRKQEERLTLLWSFCWESPPSSRSSPPSPDATFLWMWAFCSRKATICRGETQE